MPKPCSLDLGVRVIKAIEAGASRREVAESFEISPSSAVKWMQRWCATGSVAAKPSGGRLSPLEERAQWLLALVTDQPDLTLDEIVLAMRKRRISGSRSAVWRFFNRRKITFKKKACTRRSKSGRTWRGHAGAGGESRECLIQPSWCSSMRLRPAPI